MGNSKEISIEVTRIDGGKKYVLGYEGDTSCNLAAAGTLHEIIYDIKTDKVLEENSFKDSLYVSRACPSSHILDVYYTIFTGGIFLAYRFKHSIRKNAKEAREFWTKVKRFKRENKEELEEKIRKVKLFQGSLKEASRKLGRPLEIISTGTSKEFIDVGGPFVGIFDLKVEGCKLGANAIIHYSRSFDRFLGTPVKYIDEK